MLPQLLTDPDKARAGRVMQAMMKMIRLDIKTLQAAADALANGAFNGALDENALAELPDDGGSAPVDVDGGQAVNMPLGTFADAGTARRTAMQFAVLGAVDEEAVPDENGALATRLTLTRLKPGVGRQDVFDLVQTLGLRTTISY